MNNIRRMLMSAFTIAAAAAVMGSTPASKLYSRLKKIQKYTWNAYMFGHQDDPFYGVTWEWEPNRSDTYELVGDYPAVMGFDLGGIELADSKNLDSVPFTRIHEEIERHYKRGGIITISWHPHNPLTGKTAWDVSSKDVVKSCLSGGQCHEKFELWMKRVADFMLSLKDEYGNQIPVIFRPWHENNGSWFWWGHDLCTADEYKGLWNMLQDYLSSRGLGESIVWAYSPNLDGNWNLMRWLERWPGDKRVDIIGEDAYQWGTEAEFHDALRNDLEFISVYARTHKKIYALTECGLKNVTDNTWFTRVLKPILDVFEPSYFLLWRNYKKEFFEPYKGHPAGDDFTRLYKAKNTLFLKDIKDL